VEAKVPGNTEGVGGVQGLEILRRAVKGRLEVLRWRLGAAGGRTLRWLEVRNALVIDGLEILRLMADWVACSFGNGACGQLGISR